MTENPAKDKPADASMRVRVLLPLPLAGAYDYRAPEDMVLAPGDFVSVPLVSRRLNGVVWDGSDDDGKAVADDRLKQVLGRLEVPALAPEARRFVDWVAGYTLSPPGAVLRMIMNVPAALVPPKPRVGYTLGGPMPEKITAARRRVIEVLENGPPRTVMDLAREAAVGPGVVRGLADKGTLVTVVLADPEGSAKPDWQLPGPSLSPDQATAAAALKQEVVDSGFTTTLLDGVTGSGKTEVYFEAIAAALEKGVQVLVLLPEISLTAQWLERFTARFGAPPAAWHSDLGSARRRRTWRAVAEGRARVIVGARSALFLPYAELGLIVVDEEHDVSFKQEEGVVYHARDMAVVRGSLGAFPVVLASATPSLESMVNVRDGRYGHLSLPDRHGGAELPEVTVVDMRREAPDAGHWLSPPLAAALAETVGAGEQALLFLNRRGYAPLTLCRACGHRFECPNCSAWLVEHRHAAFLMCHHCGYQTPPPQACPSCETEGRLAVCGPGVERLAEEVTALLPGVRLAVLASDTLSGPEAVAGFVDLVERHEVDLLIGTQILAKGHHFPLLTLVGVIDADLGLAGGDLRAAERTYQLLAQVAGRAGRAGRPGRVFLQTYMPEHKVIAAMVSGDRDRFLTEEAEARQDAGMPPFGRLAALIVSGLDAEAVISTAQDLGRAAPRGKGVAVFGPAPAPLPLLRGRHRHRLLMKAARNVDVQQTVRRWLAAVKPPGGVRVRVDIDPYGFL